MKMSELLNALNIPFQSEGHKHCNPDWINMPCCFCEGNEGLHLGWNIEKEFFRCWRCGFHPTIETLCKLSNLSYQQIRELVRNYGGKTKALREKIQVPERIKSFKFPSSSAPLTERHKKYLEGRRFDPAKLEKEWGLLGTGPVSLLDQKEYKFRIIAPILWADKIVSFQSRDITNLAEQRYKTCPKDRELIHHKHILYGKQHSWKHTGICVEGITDVWRLGKFSFAIFGIGYKLQQIKEMVKHFTRIAIVFDSDPQAILQANKLVAELKMFGREAWRVDIDGDPGEMKQDDAKHLVRELLT